MPTDLVKSAAAEFFLSGGEPGTLRCIWFENDTSSQYKYSSIHITNIFLCTYVIFFACVL